MQIPNTGNTVGQGDIADPRRQDIIDVARRLFKQKGYRATSMAQIAEAANLAVGTLYRFFKDKNDLYQTLMADTVHDFESQMTNVLADESGNVLEQIHEAIDIGSQLFAKHLSLIRVYFAETGAAFIFPPVGLEDEAFLSYGRIISALQTAFQRGIDQGVFVDIDALALAIALDGTHNAFLSGLVRDSDSFTPEQITELTMQIFFGSVLKPA